MSTDLLYHGFGIHGYEHVDTIFEGGCVELVIRHKRASLDLVLEAFGATTGTPFTAACPKCSKKGPRCSKKGPSGPPNYSLFDFVAKNILVEITEGNARIAFRFRCLARHHGTADTEYR